MAEFTAIISIPVVYTIQIEADDRDEAEEIVSEAMSEMNLRTGFTGDDNILHLEMENGDGAFDGSIEMSACDYELE